MTTTDSSRVEWPAEDLLATPAAERGDPVRRPPSWPSPAGTAPGAAAARHPGGRGRLAGRSLHRTGPASGLAGDGGPDHLRRPDDLPVHRRDRLRRALAADATDGSPTRPVWNGQPGHAGPGPPPAPDRLGHAAGARRPRHRTVLVHAEQRPRHPLPTLLSGGLRLRRRRAGLAAGRYRPAEALAGRGRRQGLAGARSWPAAAGRLWSG